MPPWGRHCDSRRNTTREGAFVLCLCCFAAGAAFADSEKKMDATTEAQMAEITVTKLEGADKHVYTMYGQMAGKEMPMMEITYTRKK